MKPNYVRHYAFFAGLACLTILPGGCSSSQYTWGWYVVLPTTQQGVTNLSFLIGGIWSTIVLSVSAMAISVILGLLLAFPGLSKRALFRTVNHIYVEIFRSIPLLVMILWVYYGLPVLLGVKLNVFSSGLVALALSDSAFEAEIFRAGIQSIDRGQFEASFSLGLTYYESMRYVILPQALRRILPPLGNQFVYMLKMSSLVSVIGLSDLTRRANELVVTVYRPLEIYTVLVFEYLLLILLVSWCVRKLEHRLGSNVARMHP
ncbi:MAG: amino acid ABC transporter permease [bacterium]|nr:amino acid ABC transporter permease [bacterium]